MLGLGNGLYIESAVFSSKIRESFRISKYSGWLWRGELIETRKI